jgi:hypothetical protein
MHSVVARGLLIAAVLLAAPVARGAGKSREQREAEARKACAAGRVEAGIEILAELLTEYSHPNYIYNQARCYQQNGRPEPAISRFKEYLRAAADATPDERARVERFIKELEAEVQAAAPPAPPPKSEAAPAVVAPPVAEPPPRPEVEVFEPEPRARVYTLRIAAVALGAVGVAGLVTGVVSSLQVRSLNRQVAGLKVGDYDTGDLGAHHDKGHRWQTLQWVGYGIGGAALAGAVTCLFIDAGQRGDTEHAGRVHLVAGLDRGGRPGLGLAGGF